MENEKRLIEELREMAERTPPICQYDKPYNTEIFGKEITVYCKPFEQFQELLRRAADALSVDAVEVVHGLWVNPDNTLYHCSECGKTCPYDINELNPDVVEYWTCNYCPNCGAKMDGDGNA